MKVRGIALAVASFLLGALVVVSIPATGAGEPGVVHFTAAGDYGSQVETDAVLDLINATDPDLNLALGDLSYGVTGAEQAWCDRVTSRVGAGFPFELLSGNHESNGLNGNINDFAACLPNQLPGVVGSYGRQFYVDVPQVAPLVRFVMISPALTFSDGTYSYEPGTPRYDWTASAIDGARAAGVPWVVVGMHKPCLSLGLYACEIGAGLTNMLIAKKVDLVLNGHEHLYQRTHQLGHGPSCAALTPGTVVPACISDSDATMRQAGTVFATVGTGGIAQRPVNESDSERGYFAAYSGENVSPADGVLDVRATADTFEARFLPTVAGAFTDSFTIQRGLPPANQPPTAAFTATPTGLSAAFDASTSTDPDGTINSYAWNFGDGTTGSGITTNHTYPAAGTYTATLVVTDNGGLTGTLAKPVTVTAPGGPVTFITDNFGRTVSSGFGNADLGGPWTVGPLAAFSVSGGVGQVSMAAGTTRTGVLGATSSNDTDLRTTLSIDKAATGGGLYLDVLGRRINATNDYRVRVRFNASGAVVLSVGALKGSSSLQTLGSPVTVPGLTYTPGQNLELRYQVTGTNPTTLRAKVWPTGQTEPANWMVSTTDTFAALQTAGAVGLQPYLSSTATNAPVVVRIDNLVVRRTA
jgi:PKD repeat protein